jgi:hypothetical protein
MFQPPPVSLGIKSARSSERKKAVHQERVMVKGMPRVEAKATPRQILKNN